MSKDKERKFDGVWDARRVLYNVLFYADEEGYIKYVAGDAESTDGIKRQRFNATLKAYGKIYKDDICGCEIGSRIGDYRGVWISKTRSMEKMKEWFELLRQMLMVRGPLRLQRYCRTTGWIILQLPLQMRA
jgi:hypothetical protein